jgi:hypothetical protein
MPTTIAVCRHSVAAFRTPYDLTRRSMLADVLVAKAWL